MFNLLVIYHWILLGLYTSQLEIVCFQSKTSKMPSTLFGLIFPHFLKIFFNVYFWERQSMSGGGAERGWGKIPSRLWALSTEPNAGLLPTNCEIVTWAEVGRFTDWATQGPLFNLETFYKDATLIWPAYLLTSQLGTTAVRLRRSLQNQKAINSLLRVPLFPSRGGIYFPSIKSGLPRGFLWPREHRGSNVWGF